MHREYTIEENLQIKKFMDLNPWHEGNMPDGSWRIPDVCSIWIVRCQTGARWIARDVYMASGLAETLHRSTGMRPEKPTEAIHHTMDGCERCGR